MKRPWVAVIITVLIGALAGVAIAGKPTSVDQSIITASPSTAASSTTVAATAAPTTTSGPVASTSTAATTSTTEAPIDRGATRVLVANATNRSGIARSTADALIAAGFTDSTPIDALDNSPFSVVYARPGFEAQAADVADTLGLAATSVQALSTTEITSDDASGDVIVVIGDDFPR